MREREKTIECAYIITVFLLKIRHENNKLRRIFGGYSVCVRILFPFVAYTRDDLCRKLETIFNHSVKDAEFLEEIRYVSVHIHLIGVNSHPCIFTSQVPWS